MSNSVEFGELRQLLLDLGFRDFSTEKETILHHRPTDTLFVFRPYRGSDLVRSYNLDEVRNILDARGLMPAETFDSQFKKIPA
jgi:hypothetical protein